MKSRRATIIARIITTIALVAISVSGSVWVWESALPNPVKALFYVVAFFVALIAVMIGIGVIVYIEDGE